MKAKFLITAFSLLLMAFILTPLFSEPCFTGGNFFRFEAEYADSITISVDEVNRCDKFFYMSPKADSARVGSRNQSEVNLYSNKFYWKVEPGQVGYAYQDLIYKWPYRTDPVEYFRVGNEFLFPYHGSVNFDVFNNNVLYITFALKVPDIESLADNIVLAKIKLTNKGENTESLLGSDPVIVQHKRSDGIYYAVSDITKENLMSSPLKQGPDSLRLIEVSVPLSSIAQDHMKEKYAIMQHGNYWDKMLVNINPTLYWYGHGTLILDYIEFEDKLYRDYTNNPDILSKMTFDSSSDLLTDINLDDISPGRRAAVQTVRRYLQILQETEPTFVKGSKISAASE